MSILQIKDENGNWVQIPALTGPQGESGVYVGADAPPEGTKVWVDVSKDINIIIPSPVKGVDYWTATDKQEIKKELQEEIITSYSGESSVLTMSQKAITHLVDEALGIEEVEYETVDSIEEMVDTSKQYVLSTDGYIYSYQEKTETVYHEAPNHFSVSASGLNQRMGSNSLTTADGYVWADPITANLTDHTPFIIKVEGTKLTEDTTGNQKMWLCTDTAGNTKGLALIIGQHLHDERDFKPEGTTVGGNLAIYAYTTTNGKIYADYKGTYDSATGTTYTKQDDSILITYESIRIGFKYSDTTIASVDDVTGVSITFPHEAYEETITKSEWTSTGLKPESAGGNYVTLKVQVDKNAQDITQVSERVINLEADNSDMTPTIPSYWKNAVDACIEKIKKAQVGRHCVTFPFFSDNHQNIRHAGHLIAYIMKECNIPYCFYGGDAISSGTDVTTENIMITQDNNFDKMMSLIPAEKMCRALGNHDAYWNPGPGTGPSTRVYYTRDQIYELFLRQDSITQNKHYGGDGTYYYVEDIASKTRFVVCNMNFNKNTSTETLDTEQISWLENEALVFNESGWSLVFISHQPITNHYHSNIHADTANAIQTLLTNYANSTDANKADIVGWFAGHIHADRIYEGAAANTSNDDVKNTLPWKTITIRADSTGLCRDEGLAHTPANDDQSHAIDFVVINKKTGRVDLFRLGIGERDRYYSFRGAN